MSKDKRNTEVSKDMRNTEVSKDRRNTELSKDKRNTEVSKDKRNTEVSKDTAWTSKFKLKQYHGCSITIQSVYIHIVHTLYIYMRVHSIGNNK